MNDVGVIREIAEFDNREKCLRGRIEQIPILIQNARTKVEGADRVVAVARKNVDEQKRRIMSLEREIQELTGKLDKYSKQLLDVKTNKEFQSLQKEISDVETAISEREDQLLETMDILERYTREVAESEKIDVETRATEEQAVGDLERELEDTKVQLIEVTEKRKRTVEKLSPNLRDEYTRIKDHYAGEAIVPVVAGSCTGCYVNIPPNVIGKLQAAAGIIRCEQCGRFLYFDDEYR